MRAFVSTCSSSTSQACPEKVLTYQVADFATLRVGPPELANLRQHPGTAQGAEISASFLKHADEQSVAALAVVLKAMARHQRPAETYRDWGVVAAPTMFGRDPTSRALRRFLTEGAWGIAPHVIPHSTLHAISGTISQALRIQGPNLSVGNGVHAATEAILAAAGMLCVENLPGLWLVLTGYDREKIPDDPANSSIHCLAAALALTRNQSGALPVLSIVVASEVPAGLTELTLAGLHAALDGAVPISGRWRLPDAGWLELVNGRMKDEG